MIAHAFYSLQRNKQCYEKHVYVPTYKPITEEKLYYTNK